MFEERVIIHYESCAQDNIKNALAIYKVLLIIYFLINNIKKPIIFILFFLYLEFLFNLFIYFKKEWKIIEFFKINENGQIINMVKVIENEEKIKSLEEKVNKFQKNSFAKSIVSPIDLARKTMLGEYPFMAKF